MNLKSTGAFLLRALVLFYVYMTIAHVVVLGNFSGLDPFAMVSAGVLWPLMSTSSALSMVYVLVAAVVWVVYYHQREQIRAAIPVVGGGA